jgi:hypothetical protein
VAELLGERLTCGVDLRPQLLQPARNPDVPTLVAEMAAQLTEDGGHGIPGEAAAPRGIEAVDRLDQADGGHLVQVLVGLAAALEPPGGVLGHRQMEPDQLLPGPGPPLRIGRAGELLEQLVGSVGVGVGVGGGGGSGGVVQDVGHD